MSWSNLRNVTEWALLVALVFSGGAIAQAQNDAAAADAQPDGRIVRIGPANDATIALDGDAIASDAEADAPKYWLGVFGGPVSDELRAQVVIPEGEGVLVRRVVPESPASKSGLKDFDILLRANDTALTDIRELTDLVQSIGDSGGEIKLDVLRAGEELLITVEPEARPEHPAAVAPKFLPEAPRRGFGMGGPMPRDPEEMLRFFEQQLGQQLDSRNFGRGSAFGSMNGGAMPGSFPTPNSMPAGVSVNIEKHGDEPTHITVKKDNDTWEIVGDNPGSLEQLPDDVRPFVEQLLQGGGMMQLTMPQMPPMPRSQFGPRPFSNDEMQQQLHRMEEQLQQMRLMLEHDIQAPQPIQPEEEQAE